MYSMPDDHYYSRGYEPQNGAEVSSVPRYSMHNDRMDIFPPKYPAGDGRDVFQTRPPLLDDRRDSFPPRHPMLNGRGESLASTYTTQNDRVDGFPVNSRALSPLLDESSGSSGGWSSSITSYIGSWMGREAGSPGGKTRAENGLSPGIVREPLRIQGASAYYSGHDSSYPSQSYNFPSADHGSRDLSGKIDRTLAVYEPHQVALYDPQLSIARKEVKELESVLAAKDACIDGLEKTVNGKKKFIDEMEKDFKEVRKSLFVMEGRVKDLESSNAEHQVN